MFTPKTVLITGASRGIGEAIAAYFAKNGYHLILTCITSIEKLQKLSLQLSKQYNIQCLALQADMGNWQAVQTAFSQIPDVDIIINNAGIAYFGLLSEMTIEEWHHVMHTNLDSCFYTCKLAIPYFLRKKSGCILNISSVWGTAGASMEVAYSASKGAVNAFTKALAKELAPSNIAVNAIACGVIDTDMNHCLSIEEIELLRNEIPADRIGTPQEVAQLALQIVQAPSYMTGQIITIDGGWY